MLAYLFAFLFGSFIFSVFWLVKIRITIYKANEFVIKLYAWLGLRVRLLFTRFTVLVGYLAFSSFASRSNW